MTEFRRIAWRASNEKPSRLLEALEARRRKPLDLSNLRQIAEGVPDDARAAAAAFWSRRAWSEYAAVPAFLRSAQTAQKLGFSLQDQALILAVLSDEVRHAEVSMAVAEALGGYDPDVPSWFPYDDAPEPIETADDYAVSIVAEGMVSEVISHALLEARLRATSKEPLRSIVRAIALDEALHVQVARYLADLVVWDVEFATLGRIGVEVAAMIKAAALAFGGLGRADEESIRALTASAGLGACSIDAAKASLVESVRNDVLPTMTKLGVLVPPTVI